MNVDKCGNKPNCVSSIDERKKYNVEPLRVESLQDFKALKKNILEMERVLLVEESDFSAHFVFVSKIMRYKDDVKIFFDQISKKVQISSKSRLGYSDRGVNLKRVNKIRRLLLEK